MIRKRVRSRLPLLTGLESRLLFSTTSNVETTTQLSALSNAVLVGNSVTFTATVTPSSAGPLSGQWVQLWDNGTLFVTSAQLTNDSATLTWAPRTGGLHIITAEFPAQDQFQRSVSDEVDINVYRRAAQVNLQITTNGGGQVHVTATATSVDPLSFAPTGSVQISNGSQLIGSVHLGTTDSLNFRLPPGTYNFHGAYNGDGAFFPAQTTQTLVIPPHAFPINNQLDSTAFDAAIVIKPTNFSLAIQGSSLLNIPTVQNQDGQAAFHLQSSILPPDAKQFYESHVPPPLNPDDAPPAVITPDYPLIPAEFTNAAAGGSAPTSPTPDEDLLAYPLADKLSKSQ